MDKQKTGYEPELWPEAGSRERIPSTEGDREKPEILEILESRTDGGAWLGMGVAPGSAKEPPRAEKLDDLEDTEEQELLEAVGEGNPSEESEPYGEDCREPEEEPYREDWTEPEEPYREDWTEPGEEPYREDWTEPEEEAYGEDWTEPEEEAYGEDWTEPGEEPYGEDWTEPGEEPYGENWTDVEGQPDAEEQPDQEEPPRRFLWGILFVFLVLGVAAGAFLFYKSMYQVEPVFSQATYELGDPISADLEDYIQGSDWSVGLGELDLSGVDRNRAGTYEAVVRHGRDEYLYQITIEDTVAPEILLREEPIYLAVNRRYTAEQVVAGVQDKDLEVKLFFAEDGRSRDVVCFQETGSFSCVVVAEDTSGNRSQAVLWVTVDTPPEISGVQDIYLKVGSQVDFLEHVTATARRDGSLTDQIQVDDTGVDLAKEGVYWLSYRVEDSRGIEETCDAKVVVASATDLQEMIGTRQINRNSHRIIGAANPYDSGASSQDDIEGTLEYMRPAFVQLYHRSDTGYSSGSGYIMEITEDRIFICSNRHVVEKYDNWDVYFHDGTKVQGEAVGTCPGYDVGVVVLPTEDVPEDVMEGLMTVHIDRAYWSGLDDERIDLGLERVDRGGGIVHTTTGSLVKIKQEFEWNDRKEQTEVTVRLEHGDSGSAVVDGYGNLICMAFAYSEDPMRYWCVPLDGILEGYESITGRHVYVY